MTDTLHVGNAQGFWGDSVDAAARLVEQAPDLDYLTLDYLAEVSMSILAVQRERDPSAGYARDFVGVIRSLVPHWKAGASVKVVSNAGGLNPHECAIQCCKVLREAGLDFLRVGVVSGDNVLPLLNDDFESPLYQSLDTGRPITDIQANLITANAYFGAHALVDCLKSGADIVVTGRVADPSLTLAPAMAHYGWSFEDFDRIAGATMAGHLIECGAHATGGISTHWLELDDLGDIGFPIAEIAADGSCVITKPAASTGAVNEETIKEQLLYEIGDPGEYISPDLTVDMLGIQVTEIGRNRVRVLGAKGSKASDYYKVSATYRAGFRAAGMLTIAGRHAVAKARRCGDIVRHRLQLAGIELDRYHAEVLGADAIAPGVLTAPSDDAFREVVLRIAAADPRKEALERFAKELAPLVTSGPQGTTGYAEGRPKVHPVFGYWPCLIEKSKVTPHWEVL